jgi:hypothetical protein
MPPSSNGGVSPEKQLLVCCARTSTAPHVAQKIRHLLAEPLDWNFILAEAHEHSIFPLLERQLRNVAPDLVPAASAERLKSETRANAVRCLAFSAELIRIMDALDSCGIPAIPYKGSVIAAQAYADITLREFEDLDIVLRQRDLESAHDAIQALGYEARFPWIHTRGVQASLIPGEYSYSSAERRTMLELHTELTLRHFPSKPALDDFLRRTVKVDVGGHLVRTFSPEDALVVLCVHGAKDFWQKLIWVADIAELVRSYPALDWNQVAQTAGELRAQRMLYFGLALARDLLDARLPPEVVAHVEADSAVAPLVARVKQNLLGRNSRPFNARARFNFRRRLVPGLAAGWRYSLRLALAPAEEDWLTLRLPRALTPLYIVLRPLRLLRKYGWAERQA